MLYIWVFAGSLSADSTRSGIEFRMSASRKLNFWKPAVDHTAPARLAGLCRQIADLRSRLTLGIPTPCRRKIGPLRATLEQSEIPEIEFSRFSGGTAAGRIPGFGSGSVREVLGYGFSNRLIVFGFTNVTAQIRQHNPGVSFGYSSGEAPIGKCRRTNPLRFLNLWGQSREVPCIFSPLLYRLSYLSLECGSAY
jgi:hypothetical protein